MKEHVSKIKIKRREGIASQLNHPQLSPLLATLYSNRGVKGLDELEMSLKSLAPPDLLTNIDAAAELLAEAVTAGAAVVVVGDFDADGATSCALAVKCLRAFGLDEVSYLVPNRFEYGYGLSPEIVGVAAMRQPDVIVTVDNGISSVDGVHAAQALGMSVLVTDHHLPGETLPTADVIVNPNLPGDRFPSKNLAGVGVIFYVMLALRAKLRALGWFQSGNIQEPNMSQFLDLVALGTVADVVPLDRNNRILVQQGLMRIRQGNACVGVSALLQIAGKNFATIKSADFGFALGPRLNAAGRLDDMSVGIECLLSEDSDQALRLAAQLDQLNRERKEVEVGMRQEAMAVVEQFQLADDNLPCTYVLADPSWHQGIVGLVASRVKEKTNRPVIVLAPGENEGEWKGSARSIEGVHMRDMLARIDTLFPKLIEKYGGHAMAAGLSLKDENLNRFRDACDKVSKEITKNQSWDHVILSDGPLSASYLNLQTANEIHQSTPWGQGFFEPVFDDYFEVKEGRIVGEEHLKLTLAKEGMREPIDAIYFGGVQKHDEQPKGLVRVVYRVDVNEFRGNKNLQLIVVHIE